MNRIFHAYRQAPWRTQRQIIGLILAALVVVTMVSALYLDVTAQAAILGREIQTLEAQTAANRQVNAGMETRIAEMLSTTEMERRAIGLRYRPVRTNELEYLPVAGYVPQTGVMLASAPNPKLNAPTIPLEYTQSLLEWAEQHIQGPGIFGGAR